MSNIGEPRTKAQLFRDMLLQNASPGFVRYQGLCIGDASAGAIELFMNGENGSRFVLPTNSFVFGTFIGAAWNATDGDAPTGALIYFGIENDGGTVAAPTFATGTNLAAVAAGEAGGTFAIVADNTNKALRVNFTPSNNDTYYVFGHLQFAFAADGMLISNMYQQTN